MEDKEIEIDLLDLGRALVKQKQFIGACTLGCVALAGVYAFGFSKPSYESIATIKVRLPKSVNSSLYDMADRPASAQILASYTEVLKSRSVVMPVLEKFGDKESFTTNKDAAYEDFIKSIKTTNAKNADTISITTIGETPEEAQNINTMLLANFLVKASDLQRGNSKDTQEFLATQLVEARKRMESAQRDLKYFQAELGMDNPGKQEALANAKFSRAKDMQVSSELALENGRNRIKIINQQLAEKGNLILDNTVIGNYRDTLKQMQTDKMNLLLKYPAGHPEVVAMEQQMAVMRKRIDEEIAKVSAGTEISTDPIYRKLYNQKMDLEMDIAYQENRLAMGKRLEAEYKQELAKLSADRIRFTDLQRELNNAQDTYNMLNKRKSESLVVNAADGGTVQIVDPPHLPSAPAPQKRGLKLLMGLLAGLFGSSAWVIARELMNPRVRKETDITELLDLPLLGCVNEDNLDSYRVLRTNIMTKPAKSILFVNSGDEQMKGKVVKALVELMQKAELKVGLLNTSDLAGMVNAGAAVGEALASKKIVEVLENIKQQYDYVLIDSPVLNEASDAMVLANKVDGVVQLVKAEAESPDAVKSTFSAMVHGGAQVLGVVLVK